MSKELGLALLVTCSDSNEHLLSHQSHDHRFLFKTPLVLFKQSRITVSLMRIKGNHQQTLEGQLIADNFFFLLVVKLEKS